MTTMESVLQSLRQEQKTAQINSQRLQDAINALEGLGSNGSKAPVTPEPIAVASRGHRKMSAVTRRRIAVAQKARWAKIRAHKANHKSPKTPIIPFTPRPILRTISAAGRKRIAAAQRARWAKVKAQAA